MTKSGRPIPNIPRWEKGQLLTSKAYPLGILAHLLRMVMEPKYLAFRKWLYSPCSSSDKVIGSLGMHVEDMYEYSSFQDDTKYRHWICGGLKTQTYWFLTPKKSRKHGFSWWIPVCSFYFAPIIWNITVTFPQTHHQLILAGRVEGFYCWRLDWTYGSEDQEINM